MITPVTPDRGSDGVGLAVQFEPFFQAESSVGVLQVGGHRDANLILSLGAADGACVSLVGLNPKNTYWQGFSPKYIRFPVWGE